MQDVLLVIGALLLVYSSVRLSYCFRIDNEYENPDAEIIRNNKIRIGHFIKTMKKQEKTLFEDEDLPFSHRLHTQSSYLIYQARHHYPNS